MYRKTFYLKQHTPLIHFQHDQAGATLRATEVKPKLDKYVLTNLGKGNFEAGHKLALAKGITIGQTTALDYQLMISSDGLNQVYCPLASDPSSSNYPNKLINLDAYLRRETGLAIHFLAPSPYFANSDKVYFRPRSEQVNRERMEVSEIRWGVLAENSLKCSIQSSNKNVISLVAPQLAAFFIVNNFGTRSTKGFGSFTVKGTGEHNRVKGILRNNFSASFYSESAIQEQTTEDTLKKIFDKVQKDYRHLKSGQSFGGYRKAQTFFYGMAADPEMRWDKRFIKGKIAENKMRTNRGVANLASKTDRGRHELTDEYGERSAFNPNENYRYIRALLGLAEQYEFQTDQGFNTKYKVKVKHSSIQRFASPIIWKIINNRIYVVANEPDLRMFDAPFNFSLALDNSRDPNVDFGPLRTPSAQEFNMQQFLNYAFDPAAGQDGIQNYLPC